MACGDSRAQSSGPTNGFDLLTVGKSREGEAVEVMSSRAGAVCWQEGRCRRCAAGQPARHGVRGCRGRAATPHTLSSSRAALRLRSWGIQAGRQGCRIGRAAHSPAGQRLPRPPRSGQPHPAGLRLQAHASKSPEWQTGVVVVVGRGWGAGVICCVGFKSERACGSGVGDRQPWGAGFMGRLSPWERQEARGGPTAG